VANDTRVHLLRDFVLLPLELPAHLLPQNHEDSVQRGHNPNQIETRTQQAGGRATCTNQVGDGLAHGSDVAGAGRADELDEPVPLDTVVAAHRRDHGPHPQDRHGGAAG
jgi:hypothetical protein